MILIFENMIENRSDDLKVMITIQMRFYTFTFIWEIPSAVEIIKFQNVF